MRALVAATTCGAVFGSAAFYFAAQGNGFLANLFMLLTFGTGVVYFGYFAYVLLCRRR